MAAWLTDPSESAAYSGDEAVTHISRRLHFDRGTHGTIMREGVTDEILPSKVHGGEAVFGMSDPERAYFTAPSKTSLSPESLDEKTGKPLPFAHVGSTEAKHHPEYTERKAWDWATSAVRSSTYGGRIPGRPIVHDVEAVGRVDVDVNMDPSGMSGHELTADRLRITDTQWIPPPHSYEHGVQGTLEHLNWNQYGPTEGPDRQRIEHNWKRIPRQVEDAPEAPQPTPEDPLQGKLFEPDHRPSGLFGRLQAAGH